MSPPEEARRLLRAVYSTDADIIMDDDAKTLTVQLHHLANKMSRHTVQQLCEELSATETVFPGTEFSIGVPIERRDGKYITSSFLF
jgi:uncharacterized protein (DUF2267 family)